MAPLFELQKTAVICECLKRAVKVVNALQDAPFFEAERVSVEKSHCPHWQFTLMHE